jgi:hypothetical protein
MCELWRVKNEWSTVIGGGKGASSCTSTSPRGGRRSMRDGHTGDWTPEEGVGIFLFPSLSPLSSPTTTTQASCRSSAARDMGYPRWAPSSRSDRHAETGTRTPSFVQAGGSRPELSLSHFWRVASSFFACCPARATCAIVRSAARACVPRLSHYCTYCTPSTNMNMAAPLSRRAL